MIERRQFQETEDLYLKERYNLMDETTRPFCHQKYILPRFTWGTFSGGLPLSALK